MNVLRKRGVFLFGFLVLIVLMSISVSAASFSFQVTPCSYPTTHTDLVPREVAIQPNTEVCVNPPGWGGEYVGVNSDQGDINSNGPSLDCSEWAGWIEKSGRCCKTISASSINFHSFDYSCMLGSVSGGSVTYTPPGPLCESHSYTACWNHDVYWYNSCGTIEDKKEDCETSGYTGSNYCYDNDVYRNYISGGCTSGVCNPATTSRIKQEECGIPGCSGGICVGEPVPPVTGCADTDATPEFPDGKNYNLKGTISIDGVDKAEDYCYNNGLALLEWWCDSACSAGYCGEGYACPEGESCVGGACVVQCIPNCTCIAETCSGQTCDDGCGGTCYGTLLPDCGDRVCGPAPNGCGGDNACGICSAEEECVEGICRIIGDYYWTNTADDVIIESSVWQSVKLVAETGLGAGVEVSFDIKESDWILGSDNIRTGLSTTTDDNGVAKYAWTITQDDMDAAGFGVGNAECYFTAGFDGRTEDSSILSVSPEGEYAGPSAEIISPKNGEIYFVDDSIEFLGTSSGVEPLSLEWSIDDTLADSGLGSFTHSYTTHGFKEISFKVTDEFGSFAEDRILILVVEDGVYTYPFIKTPEHGAEIIGIRLVNCNGEGSFAISASGGSVECLGGDCPDKTSETGVIIADPNIKRGDYNALSFDWGFAEADDESLLYKGSYAGGMYDENLYAYYGDNKKIGLKIGGFAEPAYQDGEDINIFKLIEDGEEVIGECNRYFIDPDDGEERRITYCVDYGFVEGDAEAECNADCNDAEDNEIELHDLELTEVLRKRCVWSMDECIFEYVAYIPGENETGFPGCEVFTTYSSGCEGGFRDVMYTFSDECPGGWREETSKVPCAASIELPFFNASNLVIALIIIALIYITYLKFVRKK